VVAIQHIGYKESLTWRFNDAMRQTQSYLNFWKSPIPIIKTAQISPSTSLKPNGLARRTFGQITLQQRMFERAD
jgi:hypothetical protein